MKYTETNIKNKKIEKMEITENRKEIRTKRKESSKRMTKLIQKSNKRKKRYERSQFFPLQQTTSNARE